MRKPSDPPSRGDVVEIVWVDISEDSTGDPEAAELAKRTSFGLFWGEKDDKGIPTLITTTTIDHDTSGQNGYCIYPRACVTSLKVIKRARKKK